MHNLDEIDLKILNILQDNARARRNDIAERVNLTIPAVSERMKKLEERGLIKGFKPVIDFKIAGYDIMAFIIISMESSKYYHSFSQKVQEENEILECHSITGEGSHILKVIAKDTHSLEKLLSKIQAWSGVTGTKTSVVLSSIKEINKIKILLNSERK